jgi:polar amino acid transport system permease protein
MDTSLLSRLAGYAPVLGQGMLTTLWVSALAIVLGFVGGALLLGLSQPGGRVGVLRGAVALYVSFFRGTPLLVQLLMLFYLPGAMGLDLPPALAALLALGLNSAAFQCEILRAGLAAIPPGQLEAARVYGLSGRQVFRHIQLPQIARTVWPAVVSEAIDVLKGSAIVSVIAVTDLARTGRQIVAGNFRPLEVYVSVALCYLLLSALIVWGGRVVYRHLNAGAPARQA